MFRRRRWALALGGWLATTSGGVEASTAPAVEQRAQLVRVVWERGAEGFTRSVLLRRVVAELELRGFAVEVVSRSNAPDPPVPSALGTVTLTPGVKGAGTSLRWTPRGEVPTRGEFVVVPTGDDAPEVAAVQIAELVVATVENPAVIIPVVVAEPDVPTPAVEDPLPDPKPTWRLDLGIGILTAPGGLGLLAGPHAHGSWSFGRARRFGVGLDGTASVVTAGVPGPDGEHRIGLGVTRLHALWHLRPAARISPSLGLGAGALIGWAKPGGVTAVGLASAVGEVSIGMTSRLAIWTGAHIGVAVPRVEVRIQDRVVATAGRPLLDVALGLRIRG